MSTPENPTPNQVTQARHPWRATVRTVVATLVPLAALAPVIYETATNNEPEAATGAVATVLVVSGAITRLLALPGVEDLLRRHKSTSWLAAAPPVSDTPDGA